MSVVFPLPGTESTIMFLPSSKELTIFYCSVVRFKFMFFISYF